MSTMAVAGFFDDGDFSTNWRRSSVSPTKKMVYRVSSSALQWKGKLMRKEESANGAKNEYKPLIS